MLFPSVHFSLKDTFWKYYFSLSLILHSHPDLLSTGAHSNKYNNLTDQHSSSPYWLSDKDTDSILFPSLLISLSSSSFLPPAFSLPLPLRSVLPTVFLHYSIARPCATLSLRIISDMYMASGKFHLLALLDSFQPLLPFQAFVLFFFLLIATLLWLNISRWQKGSPDFWAQPHLLFLTFFFFLCKHNYYSWLIPICLCLGSFSSALSSLLSAIFTSGRVHWLSQEPQV